MNSSSQSSPNLTQIWSSLQNIVTGINGLQQASIANTASIVAAIGSLSPPTPPVYSTLWNPGTIANGTSVNTTIASVPTASLGCFIQPAFLADLQGCSISGYVSSSTNVVVVITNNTGGPVTLGNEVVQVIVTVP